MQNAKRGACAVLFVVVMILLAPGSGAEDSHVFRKIHVRDMASLEWVDLGELVEGRNAVVYINAAT